MYIRRICDKNVKDFELSVVNHYIEHLRQQIKFIHLLFIPCRPIKILGFADDTTLFVNSDLSLTSIFDILVDFGMASGINVNTKKTKIMGFGDWENRKDWPIPDLKIEKTEIKILGMIFCRDINLAIDLTWSEILSKIKTMTRLLSARHLTLYQRANIINSLILSKVWYNAHTYPLPKKYSKLISKEIFEYLWISKLNPIKRDVLYQSKTSGGLGIFNVLVKSQSIMASTFLKQFLNSKENNSLIKFYCALRINPIFNILELPRNVSFVKSKFYDNYVILIRRLISVNNFPNVSSASIYSFLLPDCQPTVTSNNNITWKVSWKNLNFKHVNLNEREITFKFLHNILTTKNRLFQIKKINSPLCPLCNTIENQLHMFVECKKDLLKIYAILKILISLKFYI